MPQAIEAAIRTSRPAVANKFMEMFLECNQCPKVMSFVVAASATGCCPPRHVDEVGNAAEQEEREHQRGNLWVHDQAPWTEPRSSAGLV